MIVRTKFLGLLLTAFFCLANAGYNAAFAAGGVILYTPYTKISVPPGQSLDYSIDVINNSSVVQKVDVSVKGMPRGWNYSLKAGGFTLGELAVLPKEKKNLSLKVDVPYHVNKGNYRFVVSAGSAGTLPLVVTVSEKGTSETEFTSDQPNMQGQGKSAFTYRANLKNRTADKQLYGLMADAPRGWNVVFKADYQPVTSVEMEANTSRDITIEITPPAEVEAKKYTIPVKARTGSTSASIDLGAVITGSYSMELTTPTGLLSTDVTAGGKKEVELVVRNTGSSPLSDVNLSSAAPAGWKVDFNPQKVDIVLPGKEEKVLATIKAVDKAIPGDYVANIEARTPEALSKASFRVSVKTSILWGWSGILVILLASGGVYHLFRKYGRR